MDPVDKEFGSAMGALFHQIITDMKVGAPLWEDFLSKASKLHTALKSTLSVIAAYLDAFQKIADSATNAKGATKDIGTVLTRICLRHKAVEARLKTFTSALMECLVLPLHDKLEEWKRIVIHLDKEHTKEYKKVKTDIKKRTTEAQRWQKKAKKIRSGMGVSVASGAGGVGGGQASSNVPPGGGGSNQHLNAANQELLRAADAAQNDLNSRLALLQETEKQALRSALVEERSRYCLFVACLKPVMSEEMAMMAELSHLEEIINQLDKHTADPFSLPSSTEQMIAELKGSNDQTHHWALQTPPSSPSSLGSRKSSMCSLGSIHSSSSGSVASALPPGQQQQQSSSNHLVQQLQLQQQQHMRHRSLSQVAGVNVVRLSSVSSQDSGFTSQDTLVLRPTSSPPSNQLAQEATASSDSSSSCNSNSSTPCTPYPPGMGATWPNLQETIQFDRTVNNSLVVNERPHTISTAYEKGGHHQRPALSVYTFQPLEHDSADSSSSSSHPVEYETLKRCKDLKAGAAGSAASSQESLSQSVGRPPLPQRCSSLERPVTTKTKEKVNKKNALVLPPTHGSNDSLLPDFHQAAPDMIVPQPVYMNASELQQLSLGCNGDDPASHAIYSSLASCTVYDDGQACSCHGPQSTSDLWRPVQSRPVLRRPASFSGYADPNSIAAQQMDWALRSGGNGSVRMSTIKRTSIPSFATLHEVSNVDETHIPYVEDLAPPPPAPSDPPFHLGVPTSMTNASSVEEIDLTSLPPPPDFLLEESGGNVSQQQQQSAETTRIITERSLSVADAVKTLNEIRHQPASPGVVRRAQSMRTTSDSPVGGGRQKTGPATAPKSKHQNHHHNSSTLQHSVSMKSATKSPLNHKTLPRHLPSAQPIDYDQIDSSGQSKVVSDLLSKSSFVHQLNAKLAQQQHGQDSGNGTPTGKHHHHQQQQQRPQSGQPEVLTSSRESLMDQIRRGTALRRARSTSDRSSPHFNQKHHHHH